MGQASWACIFCAEKGALIVYPKLGLQDAGGGVTACQGESQHQATFMPLASSRSSTSAQTEIRIIDQGPTLSSFRLTITPLFNSGVQAFVYIALFALRFLHFESLLPFVGIRHRFWINGVMQEISYGQSCVLVEERDYIGLSAASTATEIRSKKISESVVEGPDLRLGLGLGLALGCSYEEKGDLSTLTVKEVSPDRSCTSEKLGLKRGPSEIAREPLWLHCSRAISDILSQESAGDDPPPAKEQILGWPPVRVYRKQTLSKPVEMFVKVNMDGMTVGRKVDLSAYGSYKGLLLALEEMFRPAGRDGEMKHFLLSSESDYVLTYEDKEGDWMLVGDVPWSMFAATVKRLRIARGMEATGTCMWNEPAAKSQNYRAL